MSDNWRNTRPSEMEDDPTPVAPANLPISRTMTMHQQALLILRNRLAMYHYDVALYKALPATDKHRVGAEHRVNHLLGEARANWKGDMATLVLVTQVDYHENVNCQVAQQAFRAFLNMWNGGNCNWQQAEDLLLQAWVALTQYHKKKYGPLPV